MIRRVFKQRWNYVEECRMTESASTTRARGHVLPPGMPVRNHLPWVGLPLLLLALLLLAGCQGSDGAKGRIFLEPLWSSDITAIGLENLGISATTPLPAAGIEYEVLNEQADLLWTTNISGTPVNYFSHVKINESQGGEGSLGLLPPGSSNIPVISALPGEDGKDLHILVYFSRNQVFLAYQTPARAGTPIP